MIEFVPTDEGTGHAPVVVCEVCHHRIKSATDGSVAWDFDAKPMVALFAHKRCFHALIRGHPGWGSEDLDAFFIYLLQNTGLALRPWKKKEPRQRRQRR